MTVGLDTPDDDDRRRDAKRQIRLLVNEIETLGYRDLSPEEYYDGFLTRVVTALAAVGGAIWLEDKASKSESQSAPLTLRYQINLRKVFPRPDQPAQSQHAKILHEVLTSGKKLVPPDSNDVTNARFRIGQGNPTPYLLVLAPIHLGEKPIGVLEVFQRPATSPASQRGYLRFLEQMSERMEFFLEKQPPEKEPEPSNSTNVSLFRLIMKWLFG